MDKPKYIGETDLCPDGATDVEHLTSLAETNHCPWCGAEGDPEPDLYETMLRLLDET